MEPAGGWFVQTVEVFALILDAENVAFLCIEFHFPGFGPLFQILEVLLKGDVVLL